MMEYKNFWIFPKYFDIFCNFDLYFRWHHLATLYIIVMSVQYWTFSVLFFVCPLNIQWVLGIAMTIVREANVLILTSICTRVASNKVVPAVVFFVSKYQVNDCKELLQQHKFLPRC